VNDTLNSRRTALLLHAMSQADRNWMLNQLGGEAESSLTDMLDELVALGIPADQGLLSRAAESFGSAHRMTTPAHSTAELNSVDARIYQIGVLEHVMASLKDATPASLLQVLKDEPPELIARLLACHAWSWREGLLEQFGQARRLQVERFAHAFSGCAPRMTEVLLESLARRLALGPAIGQNPKSGREKNREAGKASTGLFKKIGDAFKLQRQFSRLKRGAR
jgi:hypothetical protein